MIRNLRYAIPTRAKKISTKTVSQLLLLNEFDFFLIEQN